MTSTLTFNNNLQKPVLGFGTANLGDKKTTIEAFKAAMEVGYRHFDTASMYGNEGELGIAIHDSNVPREDLFIATKLWNSDHGYDKTKTAFNSSLRKLRLEYIDCYMTHWPVTDKRLESWKAMEELQDEGLIRSLGVSNYTISHLQELIDMGNVLPVLNQVEFNPFLFQKDLLEYCKSKQIILEAYSPILAVVRKRASNETLGLLSQKYQKSITQIAIRWSIQHGNSVIPRSSNPVRIKQNYDVFDFEIDTQDMILLNNLNENLRLEWDPTHEP